MTTKSNNWLCRNCNIGVHAHLDKCPLCGADRPEAVESDESDEVIIIESKTEATEPQKKRYIFRETVLINAADITLILGAFFSFAAIVSPMFLKDNTENITTLSIVSGIAIFLVSLISWALFRNIAEISRMLREREEKELNN